MALMFRSVPGQTAGTLLSKFSRADSMNHSITTIATPRGKVIIRPAGPIDAVQFSELRQENLRDHPTFFGSSYEARENCSEEWAIKILQSNPLEGSSFVAENEHKLLGMTSIRRSLNVKLRHWASIKGVYIQPDWRGLGIVDGLFEACFEWAKKQQLVLVKLAVVTSNPTAIKAYRRLGFSIYGVEPKVIFYEGLYYDEYLMARALD
jgi:ribosomal protein S18 acetylase RimI-like enzyme